MMKETVMSHLIRPEDLQHHGTLFAGQMAKWLVEACFVSASRLAGRLEDIVCVQIHGISFKKPAENGDIIEIKSRVAFTRTTSITVYAEVFINEDEVSSISGMVTFVTVDKNNKLYAHGIILPDKYISENREIYEESLKLRETR